MIQKKVDSDLSCSSHLISHAMMSLLTTFEYLMADGHFVAKILFRFSINLFWRESMILMKFMISDVFSSSFNVLTCK